MLVTKFIIFLKNLNYLNTGKKKGLVLVYKLLKKYIE